MKMLPLKVLLLGWDEPPKAEEPPRPSALTLVHQLAPEMSLSVLLPYLPEGEKIIPQTQITGLGNLDPQQLARAERPPGAWRVPAAPYAGAENPPQTEPEVVVSEVEEASKTGPALRVPVAAAQAAQPPMPAPRLAESEEAGAEPGFAEARALNQPKDDLTLTEPAAGPAAAFEDDTNAGSASAAATQAPMIQALAALRNEATDAADLNFRIIQYARFAAPQAAGQDFAVIYAADWPVWLAALEIRQLTGRPLVLHVHAVAADRNTPADRGWALELERLTLRRADLILAASPAVAERLKALYDFPADRYRVVDPNDTHALHEVLNSFPPAE